MQFKEVATRLAGIPYTTPNKGAFLYNLVLENRFKAVLELGFAHGCSTCYFAAALQETGGKIDAVDIEISATFNPSIEQLSEQLHLGDVISVHREMSSYTWYLRKKIEEQTQDHICVPCFDLIFIDGPKDWTNDGAAFFMADKLLRDGGMIVFDDYNWSYRDHEKRSGKLHEGGYVFHQMSEQEYLEPQIERLFTLLVMQHPNYGKFRIVDNELGVAQKLSGESATRTLTFATRKSVGYRIMSLARRVLRGVPFR